MDGYRRNATIWVRELQRTLPSVRVWGYHTTAVPTKPKARISAPRVEFVNSAIRTLTKELGLALVDWAAMLHGGWDRSGGVLG